VGEGVGLRHTPGTAHEGTGSGLPITRQAHLMKAGPWALFWNRFFCWATHLGVGEGVGEGVGDGVGLGVGLQGKADISPLRCSVTTRSSMHEMHAASGLVCARVAGAWHVRAHASPWGGGGRHWDIHCDGGSGHRHRYIDNLHQQESIKPVLRGPHALARWSAACMQHIHRHMADFDSVRTSSLGGRSLGGRSLGGRSGLPGRPLPSSPPSKRRPNAGPAKQWTPVNQRKQQSAGPLRESVVRGRTAR
jgi:hypothetical protein